MTKPPDSKNFLVDGHHYDQLHAHLSDDLPYWLRVASQYGDPILELGCGTGRVTLELARAGYEVFGIDLSQVFLDRAHKKAQKSGLNPTWHLADIRNFRLNTQFRLVVVPFRTIGVLLSIDDLFSCFSCVRRHLQTGGGISFEAHNPAFYLSTRVDEQVLRYPDPTGDGTVELRLCSSVDTDSHIRRTQIIYEFSGIQSNYEDELLIRLHDINDICRILEQAGFNVIEIHGGYSCEPCTKESHFMVIHGCAA